MMMELLTGFIGGAVVGIAVCLFINFTRKQRRDEPLEWLDRERDYRAGIPVVTAITDARDRKRQ